MSYPWVGLRAQVEDVLARKAINTDFSELFEQYDPQNGKRRGQPNYYNILYAFLIDGHDYAKAGEYMFRFALRIQREADCAEPTALRRLADVLLLVISALQMAPPETAWMLHVEQEALQNHDHDPTFSTVLMPSLFICLPSSFYVSNILFASLLGQ